MTIFTQEQVASLGAPLDRQYVAQRQQGNIKLSYIEAWHAIDEANRIFGFDAWNRETVSMQCVSDVKDQMDRCHIAYIAKVRITIGEVIREGTGAGTGIDRDHGRAHESAAKEAESDAMKRALMTFGNPFGLALYDKEQRNVEDTNGHHPRDHLATRALMDGGRAAATNGMEALKAWWVKLPPATRDELGDFKDAELKPMAIKADQQIINNMAAG